VPWYFNALIIENNTPSIEHERILFTKTSAIILVRAIATSVAAAAITMTRRYA